MKDHLLKPLLLLAVALMLAGVADAFPTSNGNCATCHSAPKDAFDISNSDGVADPEGGIGSLKFYDVYPNSNVGLTALVNASGGDNYGVALVDNYAQLPMTQGGGSSWTFDDSGPDHYTTGVQNGDASWTFDLAVADESPGFYPFTFTVAGGDMDWAGSENFYVHVLPEPVSLLMLVSALVGLGIMVIRRRKK